MPSLTEIHAKLEAADGELEKEAEEMTKEAAEEYAAGAITARGFMDECQKIAAIGGMKPPAAPKPAAAGAPAPAPAGGGPARVNFAQGSTIRGSAPGTAPAPSGGGGAGGGPGRPTSPIFDLLKKNQPLAAAGAK
jgi:hypothetical protein